MTEPTPRSQPLDSLMKVVTKSRSVASLTLMMATQLSIPLPGSTGGEVLVGEDKAGWAGEGLAGSCQYLMRAARAVVAGQGGWVKRGGHVYFLVIELPVVGKCVAAVLLLDERAEV